MSLEQSEAIVLRVYPWSETSLVVNLYAREFGRLAMVAKGARRPKSPFEAALDLLSICRVVFISKSSEALDILTEAKLERRFRAGSWDLLRLNCGYYFVELLDKLTEKGDPQPEIFDLARESLIALEDQANEPRAVVLRFEMGLLRLIGSLPSWRRCVQCGQQVQHTQSVTFGITAGGVLCDQCQAGARNTLRVPAAVQDLLETYSHSDWRAIVVAKQVDRSTSTASRTDIASGDARCLDADSPPTAGGFRYPIRLRAAVRRVVNLYLTALLDRKIKLHAFLEELGR